MDASRHAANAPLLWLDAIRSEDSLDVGEKAALLGELQARDFEVPDGFVVTAEAYRVAMAGAGIGPILGYPVGLCGDARAEARFRSGLVWRAEIPRDLGLAIGDAYRELGGRVGRPEPPVAVRASFVGEDATFGPRRR